MICRVQEEAEQADRLVEARVGKLRGIRLNGQEQVVNIPRHRKAEADPQDLDDRGGHAIPSVDGGYSAEGHSPLLGYV